MEKYMNNSYSSILEEIEEKIEENILNSDDIIQIKREKTFPCINNPIVKWYYDEGKMKEIKEKQRNEGKVENKIKLLEYLIEYEMNKKKNRLTKTNVRSVLIELKNNKQNS